MIHPLDDRLRREIRQYRLVYTCERCSMFEPDGKRCALGYPNADHRGEVALEDRTSLVFCKEFDLA